MSKAEVRVLEKGTYYGARGAFVVRKYAKAQRAYYRHLDERWTQPKPAQRGKAFRTRGKNFRMH